MRYMAKLKILKHAAVLLAALALLCLLPGWLSGSARAETSAAYFDYPGNNSKLLVGENCRIKLRFRRPDGHGSDLDPTWYQPTTVTAWDSAGNQVWSGSASPIDPNYCVINDKVWITDFFISFDKPGIYTLGVKVPITAGTWEKITVYVCEEVGDYLIAGDCLVEYKGDGGAVTIPSGVTRIMDDVFSFKGVTSVTLPGGITEIGNGAFSGNDFTSFVIPDTVTKLGKNAFYYCIYLKDITFGKNLKNIPEDAFFCTALVNLTIPSTITSIDSRAFGGCSSLASVTIPSSVTSIGDAAFAGCSSLTGVTIPSGVTAIGDLMFSRCASLASVKIPSGVTSIGAAAFTGCSSLASLTIPASVTSIGDNAFDECSKLVITTTCNAYAGTWADAHNVSVIKEHNWGSPTYAWAKDNSLVNARQVCKNDSSHKISEVVETTYKVIKEPTYTAVGKGLYTSKAFTKSAAFEVQKKKVTIDMLPRTSIKKAKVDTIEDKFYTGSAIKPKLTIKYKGKKLVKGKDYSVTFENNIKPGKATVTIKGRNAFKGKKTVTFRILPKRVKITSLKPGKKKLTVTWTKGKAITGYQIEYSTKKNFSKSKTITITNKATVTTKIKNLKPGKIYYVRIRAYRKVGGKKYYSEWSDKEKAKVRGD